LNASRWMRRKLSGREHVEIAGGGQLCVRRQHREKNDLHGGVTGDHAGCSQLGCGLPLQEHTHTCEMWQVSHSGFLIPGHQQKEIIKTCSFHITFDEIIFLVIS
jgi:hypothetical protein